MIDVIVVAGGDQGRQVISVIDDYASLAPGVTTGGTVRVG